MIGPETADDAGVYLLGGRALIATADFITPVCDDPWRYGRVAAANSLSDVYAMGGEVLFALNLCCFPTDGVPDGVLAKILGGASDALAEAGGALLGGHTVRDSELKFGLSVIGEGKPDRLFANSRAQEGDELVLTKPLGTGVYINAFKLGKLDEAGLEPAVAQMERLNRQACRLGLEHGVHAATDITGFGLAGHGLAIARASGVGLEIDFEALPVHERFYELVKRGISTGSSRSNERDAGGACQEKRRLRSEQRAVLFDPQTSGGLLLCVPPERRSSLLEALVESGHRAARIGRVVPPPARIEVV